MIESAPFWQRKTFTEMSHAEWESLCDGCALCCCHKTMDAVTGVVSYSVAVCRHLGADNRCQIYANRLQRVPQCVALTPTQPHFRQMPETCGYRCVAEGRDLPEWHPLKTGQSVLAQPSAVSVRNWPVLSEDWVDLDEALQHIILRVS